MKNSSAIFLQTHNLGKQFDSHLALDGVDLEVRQGEVYGLIGPNGAGKTTLLRLLSLIDQPTIGKVLLDGQPLIYGQHLPEQKRRLGFLPDDYPLYDDMKVVDFLDYMARLYFLVDPARSARINEVLALVQLESKRESLIGTLSRGMRQRLSLAQAIIHRPDLLMMDEPVSGLDPLARSQFREIVKGLQAEGMTMIISSHILSDLENFCSAIGVMEQGQLVESAVLSDLYDRLSTQHLMISVLDHLERLRSLLDDYPQVSSVEVRGERSVRAEFGGTEVERARLLQALVNAEIPVTGFYVTQENLESIFLKMDYQRTA
jgi:ABC-2 type transport system ATP-binding protein